MENVLRSKTTNRPTAFKITFEAIVHVFVARHAERKGNLVLTLCMANFVLTATSLFEIWTPAWSSATASRFHGGFFSFLARMVLFFSSLGLYFFLFTKDFLPLLIFP